MGINKFETLLKLVEAMNLSLTYEEECLGRVMAYIHRELWI